MESAARASTRRDVSPPADGSRAGGFRLLRYFTLTSLAAFAAVAITLYVLQRGEENFFAQVQREQTAFFAQAQLELARQQEDNARASLLATHELGHVNLTRAFANVLWETDFAPLVDKARRIPIDRCRDMAAGDATGGGQTTGRQACFAEIGRKIMSLPGFAALDSRAYATMRATTVFKIKVFDLRGITVYSSEHSQIGEDKADNLGWQTAAHGQPASELTHRDRFSAFEQVVENRDLISSYLPVRAAGNKEIVGVFEIYSDVTPILDQIKAAAATVASLTAKNQARVERSAMDNQHKVVANSNEFLGIVGGLLVVLYFASLLIVHYGQRIIDRQARAQQVSILRERQWHREKMGALATLAANVSHEVGNPLATITGLAQAIADRQTDEETTVTHSKTIIEQTWRIAQMTRQMADFASVRGDTSEPIDVNQMVKAMCEFLNFDRRFRAAPIECRLGDRLPARNVNPDHLNEVLMTLLQTCVDRGTQQRPAQGRIQVQTELRGADLLIRIAFESTAGEAPASIGDPVHDAHFESARRRIAEMGGRLSTADATIEIALPATHTEA